MRTVFLSVLVSSLLLVGVLQTGVAAADPTGNAADRALDDTSEPMLMYDIEIDENGTAIWNITAQFPTADEDQREAFERIAADFETVDGDEMFSVTPYEIAAGELSEELDRQMAIEGVDRAVIRSDTVGKLVLSFQWAGFAKATEKSIAVGDVFTATERPWLSTLRDNEHLRIHAPQNYTIETSGMPVSNRTVWMDGPVDLQAADLHIVFVTGTDGGNGDNAGANGDGPGTGDVLSSIIIPALFGGITVIAIVGIGLAVGHRLGWRPLTAAIDVVGQETEQAEEPDIVNDTGEPNSDHSESDIELLSDEERVLGLIENNGGRMKQAAIVEETDWSNAKVSQLLSEMAEEGSIEKLRIGRENLISLAEDIESN